MFNRTDMGTSGNEAPCSSLLRRSSHFSYEGRKLRGILRNSPTRRPEPLGGVPKPLPSFAKATEDSPRLAYSAEAAASAAKAGHPRSELRGIRRRRIKSMLNKSILKPEYPVYLLIVRSRYAHM